MNAGRGSSADADDTYLDRARAESFGAVAVQYDRARPRYPEALIELIATRGGTQVLDVGCGTGKAAALLQGRGLHVLGVEIDAAMADVARSHGIDVEVGSFESWDAAGRRFDIVTSAQAWHWVQPAAGAAKAVRVLRPGGTIALFWNVHAEDTEVRRALDAAYAQHAPTITGSFGRRAGEAHRATAYLDSLVAAGFTDAETREFSWDHSYDRAELLDLLPTYSDHLLLPRPQLASLLAAVGAVVDDFGGQITSHYETQLLLARSPFSGA
jgi:SAM-dependent methyltransferase